MNGQMGQRRGLASTDIIKLNKMYKCNGQTPSRPQPQPQPGLGSFGTNQGTGFGFGGASSNWGGQATNFLRQLVSYFFQRSPRQSDAYGSNDGYGFTGRNNNGYGSNGQVFNRPHYGGGGYGFQK